MEIKQFKISQASLLTSIYKTYACLWHISKGFQGSYQGLDKQETQVLAVHLFSKEQEN
jgi:hypothetical protein